MRQLTLRVNKENVPSQSVRVPSLVPRSNAAQHVGMERTQRKCDQLPNNIQNLFEPDVQSFEFIL